jgi:hypothetical protein
MSEAGAAVPEVIYLPDERQRRKKASGSDKRQRQHREHFRTDDIEHAALHAKVLASGKSLGAYVMQLAEIAASDAARQRRRPHVDVDTAALVRAQVAFSRANNNLNQIAHAANRLVLECPELTSQHIAAELRDLHRAVESLRDEFAAPLAAIMEAISPT